MTPCKHDFETYPDGLTACLNCGKTLYQITNNKEKTMKTTVIYHSADFDGIFCREIARRFLPSDTEFIGWNFGDAPIPVPEGMVYILDLSPECLKDVRPVAVPFWDRMVWIDHHKTSIENWPSTIPGYRIDGVAACRLAWQWFKSMPEHATPNFAGRGIEETLPVKADYIERLVDEPGAVLMVGEHDIWDHRNPFAQTLQFGLRADGELSWGLLLDGNDGYLCDLLIKGRAAQAYCRNFDADICRSRTWVMEWEGLKFLCVNSASFNSRFFDSKDVPETGHDALMGFYFNGRVWTVSLYHAKHRTYRDLSVIAKRHGGGGHRGACGFTCAVLPFTL